MLAVMQGDRKGASGIGAAILSAAAVAVLLGSGCARPQTPSTQHEPTPVSTPWPAKIPAWPTEVIDANTLPVGAAITMPLPYFDTAGRTPTLVSSSGRKTLTTDTQVLDAWRLDDGVLAVQVLENTVELVHHDAAGKATVLFSGAKNSSAMPSPFAALNPARRWAAVPVGGTPTTLATTMIIDLDHPQQQRSVAEFAPVVWLNNTQLLVRRFTELVIVDVNVNVPNGSEAFEPIAEPENLQNLTFFPVQQAGFVGYWRRVTPNNRDETCMGLVRTQESTDLRTWVVQSPSCGPVRVVSVLPGNTRLLVMATPDSSSADAKEKPTGSLDLSTGQLIWLPAVRDVDVARDPSQDPQSRDAVLMPLVPNGSDAVSGAVAHVVRCFVTTARCEQAPDPDHLLTGGPYASTTIMPWNH